MKKKQILENQLRLNERLAELFENEKIKTFNFTSFGNSISTGYSIARTTKPLLLRNESLNDVMKQYDIILKRYHFARAQTNGDEHLYDWLINNIKLSEINKMNRIDLGTEKTSMVTRGMTQELIDEYYPLSLHNNLGLKDVILDTNIDLANIVIYNGLTGSFIDNYTRGGCRFLTYGIKRDATSLEAILKFIQNSNRQNGTNTQVYIGGAPNFLGLNIPLPINNRLKKIADLYANVTYIEPVKSNFIYMPYDENGKNHVPIPDVHYSEEEYAKFNNNIVETICNNYLFNKYLIDIDREAFRLSTKIEKCEISKEDASQNFNQIIEKYFSQIKEVDRKHFLRLLKKYLNERFPYDFYYIGKNNVNEALNSRRK